MKPPTVFLGNMTNPEVEDFLKTRHTVIVPTGATEQHGPHAPLLTDVLIPQEVARRVAPEIGASWRPPSTTRSRIRTWGSSASFTSGSRRSWRSIEDLCAAFAASGFKRIIFLNGHYDNTYAIAYACANAAERLPKDVKAFPVNYWDGLTAEEVGGVLGTEERPARQRRRDVRYPGDRSDARGPRARERRVSAASRSSPSTRRPSTRRSSSRRPVRCTGRRNPARGATRESRRQRWASATFRPACDRR